MSDTTTGAPFGWRIHDDDDDDKAFCASMWIKGGGDLMTVKGFTSNMEAVMFVATWAMLMQKAQTDKASQLMQEFASRVSH